MNLFIDAAASFAALYLADRVIKACLITRFFRQTGGGGPARDSYSVALIQPVTRGATNLAANLVARGAQDYAGKIRHLVVCDAGDIHSQAVCRAALPNAALILAEPDLPGAPLATKVAKMAAGMAHVGNADVVCFVDDDILLPAHALSTLVAPLYGARPAGVSFGLACQMSWGNPWESLMSGFVNANALTGYVPLTFFTPPYTVTGHLFALRRAVFEESGGMAGLEKRFDDDHAIARRVRALGMPLAQTPLIYGVANALDSLAAYRTQMRRWFVMPRQAMAPYLTRRERFVSAILGAGNLLPSLVLLCAVLAPCRATLAAVSLTFSVFLLCYLYMEARYLPSRTPLARLFLLPIVAFFTPIHVLAALALPGNTIAWRGRTYHAHHGGGLEPIDPPDV